MKKVWVLALAVVMVLPVLVSAAEPGAPPPAKPSVTSKFAVDFYGYVKLDTIYQHGAGVQDNFLLYASPGNLVGSPAFAARNRRSEDEQLNKDFDSFAMTARQSRFGFLIKGPAGEDLQTQGRLEMDFYGSAPARDATKNQDSEENKGLLMLRIATVEIFNDNFSLLAGNDWMVVSPVFPHTNNYPYGADVGNLGYRTPQVRLTLYAMDKQLALQIAATNKMGDPDSLDIDTGRLNGAPTWEWGLIYKNNDNKMLIAYTGHYGDEEVRTKRHATVVNTSTLNAAGTVVTTPTSLSGFGYYGVKVPSFSHNISVLLPLGDYFAINGEYYQGANLDGWYTGGQGNGWVVNRNRKREPLHSQGGWAEIMIKPSDAVRLYLGYGIDDVDNYQLYKAVIEPDYGNKVYFNGNGNVAITKNQEYFANLELYINPATKVAFEYMQLLTSYENAQHGLKARKVPIGVAAPVRNHYATGKVDRYSVSFWYIF